MTMVPSDNIDFSILLSDIHFSVTTHISLEMKEMKKKRHGDPRNLRMFILLMTPYNMN